MLDFFIALFGGLFYRTKLASDKSKIKDFDDKLSNDNQRRNELKSKYKASYELLNKIERYLISGKNYDEICNNFADDFEFVYGSNWRKKILIPHGYRGKPDSIYFPLSDVYWVYNLILADNGKMDVFKMYDGFVVSSIDNQDRDRKYAQCIAKRLEIRGAGELNLVLEQNGYEEKNNICGYSFKPKDFCTYPTHKL